MIGTYTRFNNAECREFNLVRNGEDDENWILLPATQEDENMLKKHVDEEAKHDSVTFAETEMPSKK